MVIDFAVKQGMSIGGETKALRKGLVERKQLVRSGPRAEEVEAGAFKSVPGSKIDSVVGIQTIGPAHDSSRDPRDLARR